MWGLLGVVAALSLQIFRRVRSPSHPPFNMRIRQLNELTQVCLDLTISNNNPNEILRVGGGSICQSCGLEYYDHMKSYAFLDNNNDPYLNILCDGRLVKL